VDALTVPDLAFPQRPIIKGDALSVSIAAASVVVTLPVIVLVLFFHRHIVQGLTAGALKG